MFMLKVHHLEFNPLNAPSSEADYGGHGPLGSTKPQIKWPSTYIKQTPYDMFYSSLWQSLGLAFFVLNNKFDLFARILTAPHNHI